MSTELTYTSADWQQKLTLPCLPPGVLERGELRIDNTGFMLTRRCQRLAWHELAWLRTLGTWDPAKGFGGGFHAALHVRQKALMASGGKALAMDYLPAMETALERAFAGVELAEDEHRTLGRAKETVGLYCAEYPSEPFDILCSERSAEKELGVVEWEQELEPPKLVAFDYFGRQPERQRRTHRCKVFWQGRTDGIWRRRDNGVACVKDTKTMSRLYDIDKKWREFKLSPQFRMYCWLFSGEEFGELASAVIDLVVVREPLKRPTAASAPRTEFHRLPLEFTREQIEETKRDVLKEIGAWLTACGHYSEPPPMTGAPLECTWTKMGCPFLSVCDNATEGERMRRLMGPAYSARTWDPMAVEEEA